MEERSVALDGPSGAGKSTLARSAAKHFGLIYVDTGALYRCVGLYTLRNGVTSKDEASVVSLLPKINIEMRYDNDGLQRMFLNGEDVTESIRMPDISAYASDVSAMPQVRAFLLYMQREMAVKYNIIMDGRDIGTVILPNAGLKIFLTADPEVRAERRYLELFNKNVKTTLEEVRTDMRVRDRNDSERAESPLLAADDAVMLVTTELSLDESVSAVCELIERRFSL